MILGAECRFGCRFVASSSTQGSIYLSTGAARAVGTWNLTLKLGQGAWVDEPCFSGERTPGVGIAFLGPRCAVQMGLLVLCFGGCFPHEPGPRLSHFASLAPAQGERFPDVVLSDLDGRGMVLGDLIGEAPTVVQLGSRSCPVFRYRRHGMAKLHERFGDRVRFVVIYTQEAHPVGSASPYVGQEWNPWINRWTGVMIAQPVTEEERRQRAQETFLELEIKGQVVVDGMANEAWRAFGAASAPAFVFGSDGRVVLSQVWVDPEPIEDILEALLGESTGSP